MNDNEQQIAKELELMRERYLKLIETHGELQKQNSLLEDRILSIVESYSEEKSKFEHDLLDAKQQIVDLKNTVNELEFDKQRYKDDCNLAVRLLHQHPNEFMSNRLDPPSQASTNQSQHTMIVPTFPPTFATSFYMNQTTPTVINDNHRYFICSNCHKTIKCSDVSVQTSFDDGLNKSHNYSHMTVKEYQQGNIRRSSQDSTLSSNSIPRMHHV